MTKKAIAPKKIKSKKKSDALKTFEILRLSDLYFRNFKFVLDTEISDEEDGALMGNALVLQPENPDPILAVSVFQQRASSRFDPIFGLLERQKNPSNHRYTLSISDGKSQNILLLDDLSNLEIDEIFKTLKFTLSLPRK